MSSFHGTCVCCIEEDATVAANPGRPRVYVIVEGGLARVVDDDGNERADVLVIDWDVIEQGDADELRDILENVEVMYHAKDRAQVIAAIKQQIAENTGTGLD